MSLDAVVVGAGPNGLAAAITLARTGLKVQVLEAHSQVGGGLSSAALTLPHFVHDYGSAIHPLAVASPAFREWPLHAFGLEWIQPAVPVVHPLGHTSVALQRDVYATADQLGEDGPTWIKLMRPLLAHWEDLLEDILRPLIRLPSHPITLAQFGIRGLPSAQFVSDTLFRTPEAKALWAGIAAHSNLPLNTPATSAAALVLALLGHAVGWPFPRGGAQSIANAMRAYLEFLGGEVITEAQVNTLTDLPDAKVVLLDSSPAQLIKLYGPQLPEKYKAALNAYRYGSGIQKFDYALSGSVPWLDSKIARSATIHLGGTGQEIALAEALTAQQIPKRPYVLAAQHTLFDPSRAPAGQHTFWAYTHVPSGSSQSCRCRARSPDRALCS